MDGSNVVDSGAFKRRTDRKKKRCASWVMERPSQNKSRRTTDLVDDVDVAKAALDTAIYEHGTADVEHVVCAVVYTVVGTAECHVSCALLWVHGLQQSVDGAVDGAF